MLTGKYAKHMKDKEAIAPILLVSILISGFVFIATSNPGLSIFPMFLVIFIPGMLARHKSTIASSLIFLSIASLVVCIYYILLPNSIALTLIFIILDLVIGEFLFGLDKREPKGRESRFWFAAIIKLEALIESTLIIGTVFSFVFYYDWEKILESIGQFLISIEAPVIQFLMYAGVIVLTIAIIGFWIWANRQRYKNVPKRRIRVKRPK